jgi:hypothetical protein
MKKRLSYPELWQKKQRELPVKGNPDAEWLRVSVILDKRMPAPDVTKKPSSFKVPKWGLKVLVGVSPLAAVYVAGHLYLSKKQHGPAKSNLLQIHRDSISPANGISPVRGIAKPITGGSATGTIPITGGADSRFIHQNKPNNDKAKRGQQMIGSNKAAAILSVPIHRDSLLAPMEAAPPKPVLDSIAPITIQKKDIQKDTSNNRKKTPKKKRHSKVSVFF